jgi:hypothetical protein
VGSVDPLWFARRLVVDLDLVAGMESCHESTLRLKLSIVASPLLK